MLATANLTVQGSVSVQPDVGLAGDGPQCRIVSTGVTSSRRVVRLVDRPGETVQPGVSRADVVPGEVRAHVHEPRPGRTSAGRGNTGERVGTRVDRGALGVTQADVARTGHRVEPRVSQHDEP